jgi:hypothetical protein
MNATIRFSGVLNGILLLITWLGSWGPTMACYVFFDMPLYKQWYGINIHQVCLACKLHLRCLYLVSLQFIEFHPFSNWPSYLSGVLLAQLLAPYLLSTKSVGSVYVLLMDYGTTALLVLIFLFFAMAEAPGFVRRRDSNPYHQHFRKSLSDTELCF